VTRHGGFLRNPPCKGLLIKETIYWIMTKKRNTSSDRRISATIDRGPARYFHGRKKILGDFTDLANQSVQSKGGTIFLIQGAPGAGKSALLYECEQVVKKSGWHVAKIKAGALWDTRKMMRSLGLGKMVGIDSVAVSLLEAFEAQVTLSKPARSTTSLNVIGKRKRKPLLLILDEAQRLSKASDHSKTQFDEACDLLEAIHNGELNKPVILLAAGLGTTFNVFESMGISRFAKKCQVQLGALSKDSEREVILDWLVKEGGAEGDPTPWIDAISKETHGWPHHILSYAAPAAACLRDHQGVMTPDGLEDVLTEGAEGKLEYYKERAYGFSEEVRQSLAKAFIGVPLEGSTTQKKIISYLSKDFGTDRAADIFDKALQKGLLDGKDGRFAIPIPSMQTWLTECYAS